MERTKKKISWGDNWLCDSIFNVSEKITVYLGHCSKHHECLLLNPLKGAKTDLCLF